MFSVKPEGNRSKVRWWLARLLLHGGLLLTAMLSISGVANASAAGCPGEDSSGVASHLFDCRAYELVSPSYKEGFQVVVQGVSEDGSSVLVQSLGVLDRSPGGDLQYELVREASGWEAMASPVGAPYSEFPIYFVEGMSTDFQSSLVYVGTPTQYFAEEAYLHLPDGSLVPMGPLEPPAEPATSLIPVGVSADMRRAVFFTHSPNHGEKNPLWPGDTTAEGRLPSLYEYEYKGEAAREPRLVGIKNTGTPKSVAESELISDCGTYLGSLPEREGDVYNAVSADGAAVFFTAASGSCGALGPPVNELYARFRETPTTPAHTAAISEPPLTVPGRVCTGKCENAEKGERQEGVFAGASQDGSRAFFLTRQSLLNGDENGEGTGRDLYEADISNGAIARVVQVSRGGPGDLTPGSGADVLGVARVSEDGSHVYFVANGALTGANEEGKTPAPAAAGKPNLYVSSWECAGGEATCPTPVEHTSFIATLSDADSADWSSQDSRPVQATPDGRFLVFQSTADLTPDQEGRQEAGQVFEYNAQTQMLTRVSQGQTGYYQDGNSSEYAATIPVQEYDVEKPVVGIGRFRNLAMSADGSRVFFSTRDALTPQALNGVVNVYEYHNGQVGLISDGHDTAITERHPAVELNGTDASGLDVFFTTADSLVPQDTDHQLDLYDARIEGGFAPPAVPAPCVGDSCHGSASVPPSLPVPGVASPAAGETTLAANATRQAASSRKKPPAKKPVRRKQKAKRRRRGKRPMGRAKRSTREATTTGGGL
jgi:hypothetical protein